MRPIDIPQQQLPYLTSNLPLATPLPSFVSLMNISLPWPLSRFSAARAVDPTVNPSTTLRKPSSIASLLRHYETPGVPPPSSRVDPLLQQNGGHVMGIRDLLSLGGLIVFKGEPTTRIFLFFFVLFAVCRHHCVSTSHLRPLRWARDPGHMHHGRFYRFLTFSGLSTDLVDLATEVAGDVVSHQIWGPRKKSWSLPMTILAGIMRDAGRHSKFVDIVSALPSFSVLVRCSDRVPHRLPFVCS
jgi:hypothetical protein